MISQSTLSLFFLSVVVVLSTSSAADKPQQQQQQQSNKPSWYKFGTNVNYRITAILDVNGGADTGPNFESSSTTKTQQKFDLTFDDASTKSIKTPGYSVPIDVLTLQDPVSKKWRQRISYYSGKQVDYNNNGEGYKVISNPYTGQRRTAERLHDPVQNVCMFTGGNSTDKKVGYLNFFPKVEQMEQYTLGKLVTTEPGVPYRVASLEADHGMHNATSSYTQPDASYDAHPGMPQNDWFQFTYEESLSSSGLSGTKGGTAARPVKWTMLARNQIIDAHTENWVLRYLSYEPIDTDDERKLWENYFDLNYEGDCGEKSEQLILESDGHSMLKLNRLGMFFSTTSSHSTVDKVQQDDSSSPSQFDTFLAQNNKHYSNPEEYAKRKAIHERNVNNVEKWNKEHSGTTTFTHNAFMDMEVNEVMTIRGGHSRARLGLRNENRENALRKSNTKTDGAPHPLLESSDDDTFTEHVVPKDFDPATLPKSFDWREHLPGSVGAVKDQGFCGSCWAFSLISSVESHSFIANGQSVNLPEQFVNDCAWSYSAHACDGGDAGYAAKQIIERFQGRIPTRDAYGGYLSVDAECYVDILQDMGMMDGNINELSSTSSSNTVQLTDWVVLPPRDDIAFKHALITKGPLSIAVNVVEEAMYYSSGVLDVASCTNNGSDDLDHAINLVGWGTDESGEEHWIVRNSWSDLWGDSGYLKVRMGDRDCGVTTNAGYPIISKTKSMVNNFGDIATNE